jgi:hypothetical protein
MKTESVPLENLPEVIARLEVYEAELRKLADKVREDIVYLRQLHGV